MSPLKFVCCVSTAVLAGTIVACSRHSSSPVSPSAAGAPVENAAADGSTLKVTEPVPVSPVNGQQPDGSLVLVASKSHGKFVTFDPPSYEFEVYNAANQRVYSSGAVAAGGGDTVSHAVQGSLEFDQPHTWRARAVYQGAVGPWSAAASFRTPSGGYIHASEIFDPLTNGRTVGTPSGPTQFIPGQGIKLIDASANVRYVLPQTLEAGEFSVMVSGIDEGSPGDKTKVMTMMEGFGDPVTNDYRFTFEKRGREYVTPGAVTWRIITGDSTNQSFIKDGVRVGKPFSDETWYFWKLTWRTGFASAEVRVGSPDGPVLYSGSRATNGHPYRPTPHVVVLGQPVGRGGTSNASIAGAIYKNVWVSANPRPATLQ